MHKYLFLVGQICNRGTFLSMCDDYVAAPPDGRDKMGDLFFLALEIESADRNNALLVGKATAFDIGLSSMDTQSTLYQLD